MALKGAAPRRGRRCSSGSDDDSDSEDEEDASGASSDEDGAIMQTSLRSAPVKEMAMKKKAAPIKARMM